MKPKLIKTEADYQAALSRIEKIFDAKIGTPKGDELELMSKLVELYEETAYPIDLPDPIEAIKFRMEQQGLKPKDMVPYIGSAPKVSEVLAGKRPLSLTMIRKLVDGLGIPAEVLLKEAGAKLPTDDVLKIGRHFPISEMAKRGWFEGFQGNARQAKNQLEDLLGNFVGSLGAPALMPALNRQKVRDGGLQDEHALTAWRIRVVTRAMGETLPAYNPGVVDQDFIRGVAKLSYLGKGPLLAKEFLNKNGIHLIVERHLPKTHLDGAAIKLPDGNPVIGMTLRHDRLDNFWFTLAHELAHISLHLENDNIDAFFDDIKATGTDQCETEADELASESLIPAEAWKVAKLSPNSLPGKIDALANKQRIHPAIIAGRIQWESGNYRVFNRLVGRGKVRPVLET